MIFVYSPIVLPFRFSKKVIFLYTPEGRGGTLF